MAERIHIDIDAQQAAQNMANLSRQVDNFALALGRVDQVAHRIFASLEQLSQRYESQGFLGQEDQRMLERGLQQWERASQILENRRRGASGRLQAAEARSMGTPGDLLRIGQANRALEQLQQRQAAMAQLESGVSNLLQGAVPMSPRQAGRDLAALADISAATDAWYVTQGRGPGAPYPLYESAAARGEATRRRFLGPGFGPTSMAGYQPAAGPGRATAAVYGPGFGPTSMAGYQPAAGPGRATAAVYGPGFGPTSMAGYQPAAGAGRVVTGVYGPGFGPGVMAGYQPAAGPGRIPAGGVYYGPGFGPGVMAGYQPAAGPGRIPVGGVYYGPGFGPGVMAGYQPAAGPGRLPPPGGYYGPGGPPTGGTGWWGGPGGGSGPGAGPPPGGGGGMAGGAAMGWLGRSIARVPGIALGYGAYQLFSAGMQSYEDRFRGGLQVGRMLQGQYEAVDETILKLRKDYDMLARDSVPALMKLAHATGSVFGGDAAIRVGRVYGFQSQATSIQARLAMATREAVPDLAAITGIYNEGVAGRARIGAPRFAEAVAAIGEVGGLSAGRLTTDQYARYGQYMTDFGGRYGAQPDQAYAEHFAGLQAPTSGLGEAVRMTALASLRRRRRYIPFEKGFLDLDNPLDLQIAQQQAGQIPEVEQAIVETSQGYGRGSEALQTIAYGEAIRAQTALEARQKYQGASARAAQPGGLPGLINAPVPYATEQARIAALEAEQKPLRGRRLLQQDADKEAGDQMRIIEGFKDVQGQLLDAYRTGIEVWNATHDPIKTATGAIEKLGRESAAAAAVFVAAAGALAAPLAPVVGPAAALAGLAGAGAVAMTPSGGSAPAYFPFFLRLNPQKPGP